MSSETHTDDADEYRTPPTEVQSLQRDLAAHPHIEMVEADTTRRPVRLEVTLDETAITPGVADLLDAHNARIEYAKSLGDTGLFLEVVVEPRLKDAGTNRLRTHGSSVVITFPRESLELSGFEEGDDLSLDARDGEIRLTRFD